MKVKQIANQHLIIDDEKTGERFFQSYDSIIVKIHKGKVTLGKHWKYSVTTSKYRSQFLGETTKETQAKLDSGEYAYDENL
jgi:hypothetical protein